MKRAVTQCTLLFLLIVSVPAAAESGYASWYGPGFHGNQTANGEIFDTNSMTAAHKTLPFNTLVLVERTDTGKQVIVRINDRGPFVGGRIIDLSRAAAEKLDMLKDGVAPVRLTVVRDKKLPGTADQETKTAVPDNGIYGPPSTETGFRNLRSTGTTVVQAGSFKDFTNARDLRAALGAAGFDARYETSRPYTRVVVYTSSETQLQQLMKKLEDLGISDPLLRSPQ